MKKVSEKSIELAEAVLEWALYDDQVKIDGWGGDVDEKWDNSRIRMVYIAQEIIEKSKGEKMQDAEVEFGAGEEGRMKRDEFSEKCKSPKFVAESILEYQNWRRGKGRYEFNEDPVKNAPQPFCSEALGIIEDAAIKFLMHYDGTVKNGKIVYPDGTIR